MTINLNKDWLMRYREWGNNYRDIVLLCDVPCSLYKTLLENNAIPDPYYRENEYISTQLCDGGCEFEKRFTLTEDEIKSADQIFLRFDCIDTLADVLLNGESLFYADNMHRVWEFPVNDKLIAGENVLLVKIKSPNKYIEEMYRKRPLWGVDSTMAGYPYIRKAHCMFGWDWGPKLPDMGILRNVTLNFYNSGRIKDVYYSQKHENSAVFLCCFVNFQIWRSGCYAQLTVTSPDGEKISVPIDNGYAEICIENPQLWWVNGFGGQPLYNCTVELFAEDGSLADVNTQRIGLRTLTVSQDKDQWGEEFCFINNGVKIFAMGANYIPEDQIVSRCSKEKTVKLLQDCKAANYNFIRVWGGGYYPEDYFYDWCDENGFIVWQDFMFACSAYLLTDEFRTTVTKEIEDNVTRLRNHPSLGLWCGNNEIESAWEGWGLPEDREAKRDYIILFEDIIPKTLRKLDPAGNTFYWPSSPSSGGGFTNSSSNHAGDMHYWDVWHNFKPIEAFRQFHYRFCSEYGFESLPDIKTCRAFADESKGDFDLCSNVMEAHQKCTQGNEKIMYYLAQMVNYPYDFKRLIYCSQIVQADCIRSNVEHMRRARGRCMGSAYWQVNDSNPVISWSSIDYFGRLKGLHYYAKRFYAPILLSTDDTVPKKPVLNISNETLNEEKLTVSCRLRNNKAEVLAEFSDAATVPAVTAQNVLAPDLSEYLQSVSDKRTKYLEYTLEKNGKVISRGTTLFVRPKNFEFKPAGVTFTVSENADSFEITLTAENYAKSVCLSFRDYDCVFSDNWFDIHGNEPVTVSVAKSEGLEKLTADKIKEQLEIEVY